MRQPEYVEHKPDYYSPFISYWRCPHEDSITQPQCRGYSSRSIDDRDCVHRDEERCRCRWLIFELNIARLGMRRDQFVNCENQLY